MMNCGYFRRRRGALAHKTWGFWAPVPVLDLSRRQLLKYIKQAQSLPTNNGLVTPTGSPTSSVPLAQNSTSTVCYRQAVDVRFESRLQTRPAILTEISRYFLQHLYTIPSTSSPIRHSRSSAVQRYAAWAIATSSPNKRRINQNIIWSVT
jgi:hypothetical protein